MPDFADPIGQVIDGKYRLEEKLGQGGMGSVFRATHLGTDRMVALKLIVPDLTGQAEFIDRFQREAKAAGRLRHPNIVDLTDFGFAEQQGRRVAYLVMELLEGESLDRLLQRNPKPPLAFVVEVVQQVCSALQEAHAHGVIHRDLKPENLWLEPNRRGGHTVKILDFGLAKIHEPAGGRPEPPSADAGAPETRALSLVRTTPVKVQGGSAGRETELGTVLGTPAYMSPEQCRGIALDPRSDLYSLGVVAFQMLSGRTPFSGNSLDLLNKHIQSEPPDLAQERRDLPGGLPRLVMEALSKDPARRPETAEVFGNAFEACAQGELRILQLAIGILLERWQEIWPLLWRLFLPPLIVSILLFAGARTSGSRLSPDSMNGVYGLLISLALGWAFFGVGILKGRLSPLVLQHLLFPLRASSAGARFLTRAQQRSHLRFVGLNALFLFCMILIPTGMVWIAKSSLPDSALKIFLLASGGLGWASLVAWILATRRYGGQAIGILPCVMFVEGLSPEQAGSRIVALKRALKERGFDPNRTTREGMWSGLVLFAAVVVLAVGADALEAPLATGSAGSMAYYLWFSIFLLAAWAWLGALDAILTALAYLRARKLARESLQDAFEDLRARQGRLGAT